MNKTVKYALILAAIAFVAMALPGAISVAFGFPMLIVSSGLALGIVLSVKGSIASRIFGEENYRRSASGPAIAIFILTGVKAFTSIMTFLAYRQMLGDEWPETDTSYLMGQYTAIMVVSLIYSIVIFASVIIRNFFVKKQVLSNKCK